MVEILKRAERLPNGRIRGVAPPQLAPRVVRHLTVLEQMELRGLIASLGEAQRKLARAYVRLGLNPGKPYRFMDSGEVIAVGKWTPRGY